MTNRADRQKNKPLIPRSGWSSAAASGAPPPRAAAPPPPRPLWWRRDQGGGRHPARVVQTAPWPWFREMPIANAWVRLLAFCSEWALGVGGCRAGRLTPELGAGHGKGEAPERWAQVSVRHGPLGRMGGTWREEGEQMCSAAGQSSGVRIHLLLFSFFLAAK